MMRHLTPPDYTTMAWANGKGSTIEMLRVEEGGLLKWRLSRASVVENGAFSLFPGIERNLTVLTGPGFDLVGDGLHLPARPLVPVEFAGDLAVRAEGFFAPSYDFNVMTARALPRPEVAVVTGRVQLSPGGLLAIYALGPTVLNDHAMTAQDLILTENAAQVEGQALVARLFG
jgi:environmental stress-induced protein Ves